MRLIHLTPGTGNFYCGSCLRDNALVAALRRLYHDALLLPMYLPHVVDESSAAEGLPIFFGGINVYLQQKSALFRKAPQWLDKLFDSPALLRAAARKSGMTTPEELGELTLSMLKGEHGKQAKELEKLLAWLKDQKPDVVCLSNSMLLGVAPTIHRELGAPVVCSLQGEDSFLDSLPEPFRGACWKSMHDCAAHVAMFVAPSRYYQELMRRRLDVAQEKIRVVYNGIDLDGFEPAPAPPAQSTIGFLSRMCPPKGLHVLVDAFIELKKRGCVPGARLRVAGSQTDDDAAFVGELKERLEKGGCAGDAEFLPNVSRAEKQQFLQSISVLSVPATYGEAFGLFVIEALASGVPVVQPADGAFPELVEMTGGGVVFDPAKPGAFVEALEDLLLDRERAVSLGKRGRDAALKHFTSSEMARNFAQVCEAAIESARTPSNLTPG
jgi:glycosyltransferase involved in cell wall biosynthesis